MCIYRAPPQKHAGVRSGRHRGDSATRAPADRGGHGPSRTLPRQKRPRPDGLTCVLCRRCPAPGAGGLGGVAAWGRWESCAVRGKPGPGPRRRQAPSEAREAGPAPSGSGELGPEGLGSLVRTHCAQRNPYDPFHTRSPRAPGPHVRPHARSRPRPTAGL